MQTDSAIPNPLALAVGLVADQQAFIKSAAAEQARLGAALEQANAELAHQRKEVARLTKIANAPVAAPYSRSDVEAALSVLLRRGLVKDADALNALTQDVLARPATLLKLAGVLATQVAPLATAMGRTTLNTLSEMSEEVPLVKAASAPAPAVDWSLLVTEGA
jgi:hypothetical protein